MFNGNGNPFGNIMNLAQMFNQFKNNPIGALMNMGYNIPQNLQNNPDPEAVVNFLRNSGQMNDQQFNQYSNFAQTFQGMLSSMNGMNGMNSTSGMNGTGNANGMNKMNPYGRRNRW